MTIENAQEGNAGRGDLAKTLAVLRRRAGLIGLCFAVALAVAVGYSLLQQKEYSASASLLFRNPGYAQDLFGSSGISVSTDPVREAATNVKLVRLDVIAARTARRLPGLDRDEVADMVDVSAAGESDVVTVTATSPRPNEARRVANRFAREFIAFRAGADRSKLLHAQRLAEREFERLPPDQQVGARGEALSRAAERLGVLASLQTGNAELVQSADLPTEPSSPKPVRNGIVGAILGLLLGIGLAFLLERLNRRLRYPEEAQEAFGFPVLATVPESRAIMASNEGRAAPELPFMENEAFRMLRASLRYFNVDRELRKVLVTSHMVEAGKSTVAWNLARVAATASKAVILETDLRNPSLARQHGLRVGPGLAELLTHQVSLDEAIQSKPVETGGNGAGGGEATLDAIVAGSLPPNPAELIESQAMEETLQQLGGRYDLIVVDTAPIGVVSDAFPLLRKVDGILLVARMGKSTRDSAARLREQLDRIDAPVLGVVANGIKLSRGKKYGYGYYGGDYAPASLGGADTPAPSVGERP